MRENSYKIICNEAYHEKFVMVAQYITRGPTPVKILYEISKSQNFWRDFGFLAFHFKDIIVVLSLK